MYEFRCDYLKPNGEKAKLYFTVYIKTVDIYKDIADGVEKTF